MRRRDFMKFLFASAATAALPGVARALPRPKAEEMMPVKTVRCVIRWRGMDGQSGQEEMTFDLGELLKDAMNTQRAKFTDLSELSSGWSRSIVSFDSEEKR